MLIHKLLFSPSPAVATPTPTRAVAADKVNGPWSPEEDEALHCLVEKHGARNWSLISQSVAGRSGKSCNQLSRELEHRPFAADEDDTIARVQAKFGNKWATIARLLSSRTENASKSHWNSTLKRKWSSSHAGSTGGLLLGPASPGESELSDSSATYGGVSPASSSSASDEPETSLTLSLPGVDSSEVSNRAGPLLPRGRRSRRAAGRVQRGVPSGGARGSEEGGEELHDGVEAKGSVLPSRRR